MLAHYGYQISRQTGSHIRLTFTLKGTEHHLTVPAHKEIRVGTLHRVLLEAASYLEKDLATIVEELFGR